MSLLSCNYTNIIYCYLLYLKSRWFILNLGTLKRHDTLYIYHLQVIMLTKYKKMIVLTTTVWWVIFGGTTFHGK